MSRLRTWYTSRSRHQSGALLVAAAVALALGAAPAGGAPLRYIPVVVAQPTGEELDLFASGDEYNNWLHDAAGYTILRDPSSGLLVYAQADEDGLAPTDVVVGLGDPTESGIQPWLIPVGKRPPRLTASRGAGAPSPAPRVGTFRNLLVLVRFADQDEFDTAFSAYDEFLNGTTVSLAAYFREVSYDALDVRTAIRPWPSGDRILSYRDGEERAHYVPYDELENPQGYRTEAEREDREHALLERAVAAIAPQVPASLPLDGDGDGAVDNVVFVIRGAVEGWSDLLWAHRWALFSRDVRLNGLRVYDYNLVPEAAVELGTLAHELFHTVGAPDLYRYDDQSLQPAGPWDIMDSGGAVHMTAHMKRRYGGWVADFPVLTSAGRYSLSPLTSATNHAYRIRIPGSLDESYVVEYRRREEPFEAYLPGSGLVVYRVDASREGNQDGEPYELYVFRPGGGPDRRGAPELANLAADVGRDRLDRTTDPYPFRGDGTRADFRIYDVSAAGGTISFSFCPGAPTCSTRPCGDDGCGGYCGCDDGNPCTADDCVAGNCRHAEVPDGLACDDGDGCTLRSSCLDGSCAGTAPTCDDALACTADRCEPRSALLADGAAFDDVGSQATPIGLDGDDVVAGPHPIGFAFPFLDGTGRTEFWVSSNGLLTFGSGQDEYEERCVPDPDAAEDRIAPFWDDLVCSAADGCAVSYVVRGAAPRRNCIVQWTGLSRYGAPDTALTFQVALSEDGAVELRYERLDGVDGSSAAVGLQLRGGSAAASWSCHTQLPTPPFSLRYAPFACRYDVTAGSCLVEDRCLALGTLHENPCLVCDPDRDPTGWSPNDGRPCDDLDACTLADACAGGACGGTPQANCECSQDADCAGREDGDRCNGTLRCVAGRCELDPETVVQCAPATAPCVQSGCDPASGQCTVSPVADGTACGSDEDCTRSACAGGVCVGASVDCGDGNDCTEDVCVEGAGCGHAWTVAPCDDRNACTEQDRCAAGVCVGAALSCDDGNPCTTDACDPVLGCVVTDRPGPCDDGDACTAADVCQAGTCRGAPVTCDDGLTCTDDRCDADVGCVVVLQTGYCLLDGECHADQERHPANDCRFCSVAFPTRWSVRGDGSPCEDGRFCTANDFCSGGECRSGSVRSCVPDQPECAEGRCDEDADRCVLDYAESGTPCGGGPACAGGVLVPGGGCDGAGACPVPDGVPCAPFALCADATACATSCAASGACTVGFLCIRGTCRTNASPEASAGADQVVGERDLVTLDARRSHDADGDPLSFRWTQVEGPVVALSDPAADTPAFRAPIVTSATTLRFDVAVSDGVADAVFSRTGVSVENTMNEAPEAVISASAEVEAGARVELDGSASSDPNGDALTFAWSQQEGPLTALEDADGPRASFIAPSVTQPRDVVFKLVVNDGLANSAPAHVRVQVGAAPAVGSDASTTADTSTPRDAAVAPEFRASDGGDGNGESPDAPGAGATGPGPDGGCQAAPVPDRPPARFGVLVSLVLALLLAVGLRRDRRRGPRERWPRGLPRAHQPR